VAETRGSEQLSVGSQAIGTPSYLLPDSDKVRVSEAAGRDVGTHSGDPRVVDARVLRLGGDLEDAIEVVRVLLVVGLRWVSMNNETCCGTGA